jgi:hypothetical protein
MSGETIDGGAPYEFDPKFAEALEQTNTEYAEAFTKLDESEKTDDPTPEEMDEMVDKAVSLITEHQGVNPKGNPTKLNKRSVLMNLENGDELSAYFVHLDEDGKVTDSLYMLLDMWEDFGRPDTITVVVHPRDLLN